MKTTRDILDERQSTHGSFPTCAEASQEIKRLIKYYGKGLHVTQKEALEMIAVKIARILNGGHNHQDSWQDIAGYAMLGGGLYNPNVPAEVKALPKPLTNSIYPESHLNQNSVWRLDLNFETKEEAVDVWEFLTSKKYTENVIRGIHD